MHRKMKSRYKALAIVLLIVSVILITTSKFLNDKGIFSEVKGTSDLLWKTGIFNNPFSGKKKPTSKLIYLQTLYFGKEWSDSYYYFSKNKDNFISERCPVSNCRVTRDKSEHENSDAVLFHVRDITLESLALSRKPNQIWIVYSLEPPWLELLDWKKLDGLFNWTLSYRFNSTVAVKHGHYKKRKHSRIFRKMVKHKKKDAAVWFVSNCQTESRREDYVRELRSHFPVDVVGGCGRDVCRPANSRKCYLKIEKNYKFYLSFENSICSNYATEKLFEVLNYYIVPVVFGGANYSSLAPIGSFINAMDYPNPQVLAAYLWKVSRNDSLYNSFFTWKSSYDVLSYPWMCFLCEKLHTVKPEYVTILRNLSNWWLDELGCKQWDSKKKDFVHVYSNTIPRYNSHDFSS